MPPKPDYNFIEFRNNMVRRTTRKRTGTDTSDEELQKDAKTTMEPNMVTPTASNKRRRVASTETDGTKMDIETEPKVVDLTADESTSAANGKATEMECDESITQTDDDENYSGAGGRRIDTPTSSPPSHSSNKIGTLGGVYNGKLSRSMDSIDISSPIISSVSKSASQSATNQQPIVVSKAQDVPLTKQVDVADLVSDFVVIDKNTLEAETCTEFENETPVVGRSSIVRVFLVLVIITGMMFSIAFFASLPMSAGPTFGIQTVPIAANNTHFNVVSKVVNMFDAVVDQVSKLDPRKNVSAVKVTTSKKVANITHFNVVSKVVNMFDAVVDQVSKMDPRKNTSAVELTTSKVANSTHFNVVSKVVNVFDAVVDQVSKMDPRKNASAVELTTSKKDAAPPSSRSMMEKAMAAFPFNEAAIEKPPLQGKMDRKMVIDKLKAKTATLHEVAKPSKTEVKKETIKTKPIAVASPIPSIVEKEIKKPISSIYFIPGYQFVLR